MQVAEVADNTALYSNKIPTTGNEQFRAQKNKVVCEFCNYKGHTKENYSKLIGYSQDFKSNFKTKKKQGNFAHASANADAFTNWISAHSTTTCTNSNSFLYSRAILVDSSTINKGADEGPSARASTAGKLSVSSHRGNKVHLPTGNVASISHIRKASVFNYQDISNVLYIPKIKIFAMVRLPTYDIKRFFVTIMDDYSKFTWIFLLVSKSNAMVVLKDFLTKVKNLFSISVKTLRTDNGSEFLNHEGKCVSATVYLINRLPSKVIGGKSPFEMLYLLAPFPHISNSHSCALSSYSSLIEPKSYREVATNPKWIEAIKLVVAALEDNHTWSIVDLPIGKTLIRCTWIFKIKFKASGEVERYKSRLVVKGYSQKEDLIILKHSLL
ncbi:uncharacterized protein [Nicotiana sylvestris]|uniref:uncharacterized protein n=1 Tax=Nicotiana sylvestris TaxID=4096 RepID=UPI00388CB4E0